VLFVAGADEVLECAKVEFFWLGGCFFEVTFEHFVAEFVGELEALDHRVAQLLEQAGG